MLAQSSLWLETATSTAQPPADVVDATSSAYLLLGLRGYSALAGWTITGGSSAGLGLGADSSRWLWFDAGALRTWYSGHKSFALAASGFALRYSRPFDYDAYVAELAPALTFRIGSAQLIATPRGTIGIWNANGQDGDIQVRGGTLRIAHPFGRVTGTLKAEAYDASNGVLDGAYHGIAIDVSASTGRLDLGGSVERWRNPFEVEWGYSAFASARVSDGFAIDVQLARSVTDAVLASPGSFGASITGRLRLLSKGTRSQPVAQLGRQRESGRQVRFRIESAADSVFLSGSFSEWQPIAMRKSGRDYLVDVVLQPGVHHYGFLLNGTEWYVPPGAGGIVDDGFGRRNATLVVDQP